MRLAILANGRGGVAGLILGLFCLLTPPPLRAADAPLSFSLERSEDLSGDYPLLSCTFRCGSKRYTFCPPANWKVVGGASSMSFSVPVRDGDAVARFRIGSTAELAVLNPDQKSRRDAVFRQNLPAGLSDLKQVGEADLDPVPVLSHKSIELIYRYNFFGLAYGASVMICQLDDENGFVLTATAPAETCDAFITQVQHTLGSMRVDEDKAPPDRHQ